MALRTNRIPALRVQPGRIRHADARRIPDVFAAGAMTPLATDSLIQKWRIAVTVLRSQNGADAAGMAPEARGVDRAVKPRLRLPLVAGRRVPDVPSGVPRHRQLEDVALPLEEKTAPDPIGA